MLSSQPSQREGAGAVDGIERMVTKLILRDVDSPLPLGEEMR